MLAIAAGWGTTALLAAEALADDHKIPSDSTLIPPGEKEKVSTRDVAETTAHWKPGTGLTIKSSDGDFGLATRLRLQTLATFEDEPGSRAQTGLMLRRARLQFKGNTFGKHNKFKAELAFSPRDLRFKSIDGNTVPRETPLLTWYVELDYLRDLTLRVGQYKLPFSRQRVISSGNQQMVDRSIANGEFNIDRDVGFDIRSKDLFGLGKLRYYLGIYNGEGRSPFSNGDTNFLYLARVEFLPLGLFKDYSEGDLQRLARPGLSIGLGYVYGHEAAGTKINRNGGFDDGGTANFHDVAADVTFKYQGLSLSSEVFYRTGTRNPGGAVDDMGNLIPTQPVRKGIGWFAQAGYLLPRMPIEIAGRFGQILGRGTTALSDENEAGLAASYYFAHHPLKLQADAFQLWEDDFGDGATRVRVQAQVSF